MFSQGDLIILARAALAVGSGRELLGIGLATLTYTVVAWGEWPLIT